MASIVILLLSLFAFLDLGLCTPFESCFNATKPNAMRVSGCDETPCKFVQGSSAAIEIDLTIPHDIEQMTAKVTAIALGVETNYPLPNPDFCSGLIRSECPLDAGEDVTYRFEMPILSTFPKIFVIVEFYLQTDKGIEFCTKFPGIVV